MWVTTSSTVWLSRRGTSYSRKAPCAPPRQTRTRSDVTAGARDACSGTLVEPGEHELAMPERFRRGEPAVGGAEHALEELVAGLVGGQFLAQQPRDVHVDVLAHRAHCARIGAQLDHGKDRV